MHRHTPTMLTSLAAITLVVCRSPTSLASGKLLGPNCPPQVTTRLHERVLGPFADAHVRFRALGARAIRGGAAESTHNGEASAGVSGSDDDTPATPSDHGVGSSRYEMPHTGEARSAALDVDPGTEQHAHEGRRHANEEVGVVGIGDGAQQEATQAATAVSPVQPTPTTYEQGGHGEEEGGAGEVGLEKVSEAGKHAGLAVERKEEHGEEATSSITGMSVRAVQIMKYSSFVLLVLQNSALTCAMRWSRAKASGPLYYTSTAVVMSELLKLAISAMLLMHEKGSVSGFLETVQTEIIGKPDECLKLLVPGLLYTMQNNLQYIASSNLQPAVFQVMYQVKMLTTAVLSVTMLRKTLKVTQWMGISLLMAGLVLVQLSQSGGAAVANGNLLLGFSAVLTACTLAGFAGCYLERVLKGSTTSLWIRNLQLGVWGSLLGVLTIGVKDGRHVMENGFFHGYSKVVWGVIGIQACGGLLISLVVRYGDALLKGFATGLAIIVTTVASVFFFDFKITNQYLVGTTLVFAAILLYSNLGPQLLSRLLGKWEPSLVQTFGPKSGFPWSATHHGGWSGGAFLSGQGQSKELSHSEVPPKPPPSSS